MRRVGQTLAVLFALALVAMLCGCGGGNGPGDRAVDKPVPDNVISGKVTTETDEAVEGVTVTATGCDPVQTDRKGKYAIEVTAGESYTVTPSYEEYEFDPPERTNVTGGTSNADFTMITGVTPPPQEGFEPAIVCSVLSKGLAVMSADGSQYEIIHSLRSGWHGYYVRPTWKPDGSRIAYVTGEIVNGGPPWELHFINPDGSNRIDVGEPVPPTYSTKPDWCPLGDQLIYASGGVCEDFWLYDVPAGPAQTLGLASILDPTGNLDLYFQGAQFSPDIDTDTLGYQGLLAFYLKNASDYTTDLWAVRVREEAGALVVDPDPDARAIGPGFGYAGLGGWATLAFSPSGNALAYGSSGSILTVTIGGDPLEFGTPTVVYQDPGTYVGHLARGSITWSNHTSPDDQIIVFGATSGELPGGAGACDLYWVPADGSGGGGWLTQQGDKVSVGEPEWNPAWVETP